MNTMFQDTHKMLKQFCHTKGLTENTSHALFTLLDHRYFMLQQKPQHIIKQFSNDDKEKVYWVCLRILKKSAHLKTHWAQTHHNVFTQLIDDGHATSNEACNTHFKELIFPILTHTRALPRFYFTQHYAKLRDTTLHKDLKFI